MNLINMFYNKTYILIVVFIFVSFFPHACTKSVMRKGQRRAQGGSTHTSAVNGKNTNQDHVNVIFRKGSSASQHLKAQGKAYLNNNKYNLFTNFIKDKNFDHAKIKKETSYAITYPSANTDEASSITNSDSDMYYNSHSNGNVKKNNFRFTANKAYINLRSGSEIPDLGKHAKKAVKAVKKLINGGKKGGCKGKNGKVGKTGKGGKCEDLAPPRNNLQSTALSLSSNIEDFYVHPDLAKPILMNNLKKEAEQMYKKARKLNDITFPVVLERFLKDPPNPLNYLPKKICIIESDLRRAERVKNLKIPWTPPFVGPNPIDCKPVEPEKPTCCACQPHPEAREPGTGTEDFGPRAGEVTGAGDFDPKKANFNDIFNFLQIGFTKVNQFLGIGTIAPEKEKKEKPKPAGKHIEPETKSKTSKSGRKAQPNKCCACPKDPEEETRKTFKLKMLILCNLGCKIRRYCANWRKWELTQILKDSPDPEAVDGDGDPIKPREWMVARQCDVQYT